MHLENAQIYRRDKQRKSSLLRGQGCHVRRLQAHHRYLHSAITVPQMAFMNASNMYGMLDNGRHLRRYLQIDRRGEDVL